ncbi:hypothetical protein [Sphingobacterium sp. LRF_L2]|uniref:hypothetical protein n=1 Tax=Sphingobacterium sp. LRF_L2 TaxID=3369421 RepID=UPI003F606C73
MKKLAVCLFVGLGLCACADFIEYPLEKESVVLLAPADNLETQDTVLTFWWETHQDARYYRLQIVRPNFQEIETLVMDSLVTKNQLTVELQRGNFAWRVRPENDGSVGLFKEERSLHITE